MPRNTNSPWSASGFIFTFTLCLARLGERSVIQCDPHLSLLPTVLLLRSVYMSSGTKHSVCELVPAALETVGGHTDADTVFDAVVTLKL